MTEPRKPRTRKSKGSDLELGIIVAAAWLCDAHGEDTLAEDLLQQHGVTHYGNCDEWDRERLEAAGIKLKEGWDD